MLAGVVVKLPRTDRYVCGGCRRIVEVGATVALDLPDGCWTVVCWSCYAGETVGAWRGSLIVWDGECWVSSE